MKWFHRWRRHRAPLVGYAAVHPLPPMTVRRLPLSDADRRWRDEITAAGIFGPDPARERTPVETWLLAILKGD